MPYALCAMFAPPVGAKRRSRYRGPVEFTIVRACQVKFMTMTACRVKFMTMTAKRI